MTKSESKLKLTPVKVSTGTKEIVFIQNITYIDVTTARDSVRVLNMNRDKNKKEIWVLAFHSKINGYLKGVETFQNTFTK